MHRLLVILAGLIFVLGAPVAAQGRGDEGGRPPGPGGPFDDRPKVVRIRFEGNRRYTDEFLKEQILTKVGRRLDMALLSRDERILREYFKGVADIDLPPAEGGVEVVFFVLDREVVGKISFDGLSRVKEKDFESLLSTRPGRPLLSHALRADEELLERLHREQHYHFVEVQALTQATNRPDVVDVHFIVIPGSRVKVDKVIIEGNVGIESDDLQKILKNNDRYKRLFFGLARIFGPTYFDRVALDDDRRKMEMYYDREGWLDAKVILVGVIFNEKRDAAVIRYRVEEGARYTLRKFEVQYEEGGEVEERDKAFLNAETLKLLSILQPGAAYRRPEMDQSRLRIEDRLWSRAYAESRLDVQETPDPVGKTVDVVVKVTAGPKIRLGRVRVVGNRWTRDNIVRRTFREGALPDEELDVEALKAARTRLQGLRYFSMVRFGNGQGWGLVRPSADAPKDIRDVEVEVEETDTRNFSIGAGISTDGGAFGNFSVTWNNFDIGKPPARIGDLFDQNAFRGNGQRFTISAAPGTEFSRFQLAFDDPSLHDSRWGLGVDLSRGLAAFTTWTQTTDQLRVSVRRFLDMSRRWLFTVNGSMRQVLIDDPRFDAPVDALDDQGWTTINGMGVALARSRRNEAYLFLDGHKTRVSADVYGGIFLGQVDLLKLYFEHSSGMRTFRHGRDQWQRARTTFAVGWATPYGDSDRVPVFERYFLGGRNLRGFEFREVGPKSNGNSSGGTFVMRWSTQYTFPLTSAENSGFGLDLNLWVDQGTLLTDAQDLEWDLWRISAGFGVGIGFGGPTQPPLIIDFGWPIRSVDTDKTQVVSIAFERNF